MEQQEGRGSAMAELLLTLCLVVLFGGVAVKELSGRSRTAQAQQTAAQPRPQSTVAQKIAASQQLLDINTASPEDLLALPGMGAEYARRVIAGRPYSAKNQLATRGILPRDEYERIRELIVAHRPKPS